MKFNKQPLKVKAKKLSDKNTIWYLARTTPAPPFYRDSRQTLAERSILGKIVAGDK